jgi:hypothetical protein
VVLNCAQVVWLVLTYCRRACLFTLTGWRCVTLNTHILGPAALRSLMVFLSLCINADLKSRPDIFLSSPHINRLHRSQSAPLASFVLYFPAVPWVQDRGIYRYISVWIRRFIMWNEHTCVEFHTYSVLHKSRDSSVGIALDYRLDDRGSRVRFPVGAGNLSLHRRVQNGSGAHPASYPEKTTSNEWNYTSTPPIRLHGVVLS